MLKKFTIAMLGNIVPSASAQFILDATSLTTWVLWVNLVDLGVAVLLVAMSVGSVLAVTAGQAAGQESALPNIPEGMRYDTAAMLVFMALFLIHLILREVVVPLVKRRENGNTKVCQGCADLKVLEAHLTEYRESQKETNEQLRNNVKRLFELLDKRK